MFDIQPKQFKKILVGVDDAPDARAAFSYAVDKAKRDNAELGIVSVYETNEVNVYQALNKDYVHSSREELKKRINEYVEAAIDYGEDPKKITAIIDEGDRPSERICHHVIPEFHPDLLIVGSIGKPGNRHTVGSQASYMVKHSGTSVFVIRTDADNQ
ncbi:universal stress protein [Limosilactobacillus coleohominis]|uniref:Universal stress protein n=1 Tax=Limosilactobacillus coleohominis TaxID=181675 RepID=A0ABS2GYJ9_9LACO|nr:universal stress protein [Limosilactobacillus coleohominis]MBM6941365.1 universal stress protein [Limosilactobacillus coleohominis]